MIISPLRVVLFLSLGAGLPALAQEAPASEPAPEPAASAPAAPAPTEEVRETWNSAGQLVRRLTLRDGALVEEVVHVYDASGHLTQSTTTRDGHSTVESRTWGADGTLASLSVSVDGAPVNSETYTWAEGRMATRARTVDGQTETTTFTYNTSGAPVLVETRRADGALVGRTVSDREAPPVVPAPVPIKLSVTGGVATDSDVQTTSVSGGFSISRKPDASQYATDHLEVGAYGGYTRAVSKGERTNDDLTAGFGLDYNQFVPRTSAFLFTAIQRNPVANLDVDLEVAPIGIKYDLVPEGGLFWMDASFAPLWNYRSILVAAGETCEDQTVDVDTHCTFSDLRGSLRVRLGLVKGGFALKDTVEFLPTLTPDGSWGEALSEESIFRNTGSLSIKLTDRLSLGEKVVFTRDMRLKDQVDCSVDPDSRLCEGTSLQSTSTLSLDMSF